LLRRNASARLVLPTAAYKKKSFKDHRGERKIE
jgi:hypothetical protein